MKGIFSELSLNTILLTSLLIDKAAERLDSLPESEHLAGEIEALSAVVAKLDAILKDEEF